MCRLGRMMGQNELNKNPSFDKNGVWSKPFSGSWIQIFVHEQVGENPLFTVHERFMNKFKFFSQFFFFVKTCSWTRRTVHELFMNMFKFQDEIWTKLEQVQFEQVHEHVHEQNLNKLNLNKFMNMFMDKLNSAMKTHDKKKSRKIKKL